MNIKVFILALFIFFMSLASAYSAPSALSQIRLGRQNTDTVRLVMHLSERVEPHIFTLQNPPRIVLDFNQTKIKSTLGNNIPQGLMFIQNIRLGEPKKLQSRIVLETTQIPNFDKGFYLAPVRTSDDWRYVLDLKASESITTNEPLSPVQNPSVLLPITPTKSLQSKVRKPLIVLDPGHGGKDPGAISHSGKYEKNLTLLMAKETKKALEKTGKYRVLLTRDKDVALTLRERIAFAHKNEADLFISIHADSAKNKKARGLSVYTISEKASDKEAMALAERENKADIILGVDLSDQTPEVSNILIDLAKRATMDKSASYANILVDSMGKNVTLVKDAHRFAGFVVLKSPNIPSVLLEIGYLSNKYEEKLLSTSSYRNKLTQAIIEGVHCYFTNLYE